MPYSIFLASTLEKCAQFVPSIISSAMLINIDSTMPRSYVSGCSTGLSDYKVRRVSWKENTKVYLSQLQNVFVPIAKCICLNYKMYLAKFQKYFSKLQNPMFQSAVLSDYTVRRVSWEKNTRGCFMSENTFSLAESPHFSYLRCCCCCCFICWEYLQKITLTSPSSCSPFTNLFSTCEASLS